MYVPAFVRHLKFVLLSLGVVLGYGSAIAHFAWHRGYAPGGIMRAKTCPGNAPAPRGGATSSP